eukprot:Hpha_TRINITY_DN22488_c0_g1::TRINITY_DN22488_c0_g1_i1::g.95073::m.95073
MRAVVLLCLVLSTQAGKFKMDGEDIEVIIPGENEPKQQRSKGTGVRAPGRPGKKLLEWLEDAGGEVDPVKFVRLEDGSFSVVAARDLDQGSLLLRIPFTRRFGGDQLPPEARKAIEAVGGLKESQQEFLKNHKEEMVTALALLIERNRLKASRRRSWLETLPPAGALRSGLSFTTTEFDCLSPDVQVHVHTLRAAVKTLREVVQLACGAELFQKMCPDEGFAEEDVRFAAVFTMQRARRFRPDPSVATEELTLFPVVDLFTPTPDGQVVPAGLFYDKKTHRTTAATFTLTRRVRKGERLNWSPQGGQSVFHAVGLYGTVHKEPEGWPLRLTWSRLSQAAQERLATARCGDHATVTLLRNGSFSPTLLECLRIAAAFQQRGDEAAALDLSTAESTPTDLRLAAYDLLGGVLTTEEKKIPKREDCAGGEPGSTLDDLVAMHWTAVETLKAASDVLHAEAEGLLASLDPDELVAEDAESDEGNSPQGGTDEL